MKKIGYPEIEAQKRAHAAFVEKLVNIDFRELEAMDDNQEEYLMDLIGFLLGWLSNHILASDKKIGKYIKEHNIVLESNILCDIIYVYEYLKDYERDFFSWNLTGKRCHRLKAYAGNC